MTGAFSCQGARHKWGVAKDERTQVEDGEPGFHIGRKGLEFPALFPFPEREVSWRCLTACPIFGVGTGELPFQGCGIPKNFLPGLTPPNSFFTAQCLSPLQLATSLRPPLPGPQPGGVLKQQCLPKFPGAERCQYSSFSCLQTSVWAFKIFKILKCLPNPSLTMKI